MPPRPVKTAARSLDDAKKAAPKWLAFRVDWLVIAAAMLVLCQVVTDGEWKFFPQPGYMEEFYDAQAQSLLQGRIDVPAQAIDREAFVRQGKSYGYFGPTPALLRLPLEIFAPGMYGHWSRVSMLMGSLVILCSLALLLRRLEEVLQLKGGLWLALRTIVYLSAALGSTNLYISTESKLYQEAIMWGSAFAMAQTVCLVCYLLDPLEKWLVLSCVTALLSFFARVSSGAGPLVSLLIVDVALLFPVGSFAGLWRAAAPQGPFRRRAIIVLTSTLIFSAVAWAGLNYWKYGFVFTSQPIQLTVDSDKDRMQRTKGDVFSIANLPLTAFTYLSPRSIEFKPAFPWIFLISGDTSLPARFPHSHFDNVETYGSLPATVPFLLFGGIGGTLLCFLGPHRERLRAWRAPLCGAFAGGLLMFTWGYITYRYLQDALPWLAVGSALAAAHIPLLRRTWGKMTATALVVTGAGWGLWANIAFSALQVRHYAFPEPDDKREAFYDFSEAINRRGFAGAVDYLRHWRAYIPATNLRYGNVTIYTSLVTPRADQPVVWSDEPSPRLLEYQLEIPRSGIYEISVLYASAESRPLRVLIAGKEVLRGVCAETTGGWDQENQRWCTVARFTFNRGTKDFALQTDAKLPVIRMIRVVKE